METSTERPMAHPAGSRLPAVMDEPTLDCSYCDRPGYLEKQLQCLDGEASWRTIYAVAICQACWTALAPTIMEGRQAYERLVLIPL